MDCSTSIYEWLVTCAHTLGLIEYNLVQDFYILLVTFCFMGDVSFTLMAPFFISTKPLKFPLKHISKHFFPTYGNHPHLELSSVLLFFRYELGTGWCSYFPWFPYYAIFPNTMTQNEQRSFIISENRQLPLARGTAMVTRCGRVQGRYKVESLKVELYAKMERLGAATSNGSEDSRWHTLLLHLI